MRKLSILFIFTLLLIVFTGCNKDPNVSPNMNNDSQLVEYGVAGYITEITVSENESILGTILVEGSKDNGAMYDKAMVTINPDTKIYLSDLTDFDALEVGMYVNVFFTGTVKESYPVQADAQQINIIPSEETDGE